MDDSTPMSVSGDSSAPAESSSVPGSASTTAEGYAAPTGSGEQSSRQAEGVTPEQTTEDSNAAVAPIVPPDDSDLEGKPGVEGLQNVRQAYRALEADMRNAKPTIERINQLGGLDRVAQDSEMVNSIFTGQPETFWNSLYGQSPEATASLVESLLQQWPEHVAKRVTELGLIDQPQAAQQPANTFDPTELNDIPDQFHDLWKALPDDVRWNMLDNMTKEGREWQLGELAEAQASRQQARQAQQAVQQQQQQQYQRDVQGLYSDLEKAVWSGVENQLAAKLKFTGDETTDKMVLGMFKAFAVQELTDDPSVKPISAKTQEHLDKLERRQAMGMAAQLQAQAAIRIGKYVEAFDKVFDGYRRWMEHQRGNATNRTEAPAGNTTQFQQNGNNQLPGQGGDFETERLRAISRNIFG